MADRMWRGEAGTGENGGAQGFVAGQGSVGEQRIAGQAPMQAPTVRPASKAALSSATLPKLAST